MVLRVSPGGGRGTIAAAAMLDLELDHRSFPSQLSLHSIDRRMVGERALLVAVERRLEELMRSGGRLVTWGEVRDLTLIRLGSLQARNFRHNGAAAWLEDLADLHDDVMEALTPLRAGRMAAAGFLAAMCGNPPRLQTGGPQGRDRIAAEFTAVRVLTAYLHLLAERERCIDPLAVGVSAIAEMINSRAVMAPHLTPILMSDLFQNLAPPVF